jgi:hypothetical protein
LRGDKRGSPYQRRTFAVILSYFVLTWTTYSSTLTSDENLVAATLLSYVINDVAWHSEVAYSTATLAYYVGSSAVTVYDESMRILDVKPRGDRRSLQISNDPAFVTLSFRKACSKCWKKKIHIPLFLVTPEQCSAVSQSIMQLALNQSCVTVFWMCHNMRRCLDCLIKVKPSMHVMILAPTLRMRDIFRVKGFRAVHFLPLPFNHPPLIVKKMPSRSLLLIVPGSINMSKRNYEGLLNVANVANVKQSIEIFIVGKCMSSKQCESLRHIVSRLRHFGVRVTYLNDFVPGRFVSFESLQAAVNQAHFIFPAIDDTVAFSDEYSRGGKLSASFILALGTSTPLITWCPLLPIYNLSKQVCFTNHHMIKSAVEEAMLLPQWKYEMLVDEILQAGSASRRSARDDIKCELQQRVFHNNL